MDSEDKSIIDQSIASNGACGEDLKKLSVKLGARLQTIASFVPFGSKVGDIGTDHAYLPLFLIQQGIIREAVGIDVHQGPYISAMENVNAYGLQNVLRIRHGDGLIPLVPGEVDTLVIAGMGGVTMLEILASKPEVLQRIDTLILQPQGAESRVRNVLLSQGWRLKQECLVEEDDRIYTVIQFSRSEGHDRNDIEERTRQIVQKIMAYHCDMDSAVEEKKDTMTPTAAGRGETSTVSEDAKERIALYERMMAQLIWQIGPLIVERKEALICGILDETSTNLKRVVLEMTRTDRAQVTAKATQMKKEIAMVEVMKTWLYR
ncbi:class I SAM-dependent methyltransferase [Dehalobacter sp. DCM]|uniref:tRNA (adenine(22)-N(1))-methyltransferase n=1 Tax=Dehalobacter sp. DCM TaxID=2907827 RepID=UPI0030820886|nr:class I SAM-dependent methyltransferase [Dehalobacter sp. DCM]